MGVQEGYKESEGGGLVHMDWKALDSFSEFSLPSLYVSILWQKQLQREPDFKFFLEQFVPPGQGFEGCKEASACAIKVSPCFFPPLAISNFVQADKLVFKCFTVKNSGISFTNEL